MIFMLILKALIFIGCIFGVLIFAMLMTKPVNKIFNWFNKKGWFD